MTGTDDPERGSVTPMVVGLLLVLGVLVAVVVDASAAYLRRQGLDATADAAALAATDGLQGEWIYTHGVGDRARIDPAAARRFVVTYLRSTDAFAHYPGLAWSVRTTGDTVVVDLAAPLDLPLRVPGVAGDTVVHGTAAAVVAISD